MKRPLGILAAVALVLGLAAPATAARSIARDGTGDGRFDNDITKVTVDHRLKRVHVKVRAVEVPEADPNEQAEEYYFFVDTVGDSEPDFVVNSVLKNELADEPATYVYRAEGGWPRKSRPWDGTGAKVDCGLKVTTLLAEGEVMRTTLGRGCFKTDGTMPTRLRTTTGGRSLELGWTDHVGGWKVYGPWTKAG